MRVKRERPDSAASPSTYLQRRPRPWTSRRRSASLSAGPPVCAAGAEKPKDPGGVRQASGEQLEGVKGLKVGKREGVQEGEGGGGVP